MELYQQLVLAYTSTNNQIRTQAEQTLFTATIENIQNFQFFAQLTQTQDKMQEQAASLLNSVVFKMITTKIQLQQIHAQLLCQIISSPTTPLKCKQLLQKSISLLIRIEKSIKPEIENKMKELLKGDQFWQIQSGTLFFKNLVDSLELQSYNLVINTGLEWISDFFNSSAHIVKKLLEQSTDMSDEYVLTLRFYMQVVQEFCEKFFKGKTNKEQLIPIQNTLFQLPSFQFILQSILQYSPQIGTQIQNCIIISTGNELFDNRMNEIKMLCLKSLMLVLNIQLNNRNKAEIKKGAFSQYLLVLVQLLLYSLFTYFAQYKVNIFMNKPYLPNIITFSLKLLANLGGQTELYSLFADSKIALITEIIYPMLITSQSEYQQMRDLPEEFVGIALDTVDKQESEIPKTAAAQLIETLCDHVDGSTSFVSQLSVFIVQSSIQEMIKSNLLEQQHPFLLHIKDKNLFKDFTCVDRIESSLLILTIISYLLQKRQDIINLMEKMLTDNLQFFLETKEQIIKVRLSLFFGYYCDNLFKQETQSQSMLQFIQILISFIQPNEPVVLYQAIDALKDVFEDDELVPKTRLLVTQVFPQLIGGLNFSTYERHFEMVINLVKKFPQIFIQNDVLIVNLVQILVQRIINEEQHIQSGDKERCIHLNRCWNIIRTLPEQNELKPILPKIEQAMTPIYELLTKSEIMNFYEDFVLFISALIEKQESVSFVQKQILPYFSLIIKKQQGRLGNLFETLNLYMYYGRNLFLEEQTQSVYFTLALQTLIGEESFEDIDLAEGALLVQLGILKLNKDINKQILQQVFQQILQILNKENVYGIIRSRITSIFLAAFYSIPSLTYELLGDLFQNVFNKVLVTDYHPGYDIKLFVITMSSLIKQQQSIFNADVARIIVKNLNKQEDFEKDEKKKNDEDEELMEDDEDDDEDDFEEEEERQQAQQQIEQFKSDIIKQDEFSVFRNTIFELKQSNPQLIELLKQSVDAPTLQKLNQLLSFIRIEASDGSDQARKLMKATKRKQLQK